MRPIRMLQSSFTSGELAPTVAGRIEVARYYSGAELMQNVLVRPQGGFRRRPGMLHVATLAEGTDGLRLIPFAFNTEQTYLIVLTTGRFRVFRADGTLLAFVTGCPWTGADAQEMNWAQSADTLLLTHRNHPLQRIRRGAVETSWTRDVPVLTNVPQIPFGNLGSGLLDPDTVAASATTGAITLSSGGGAVFNNLMTGWIVTGNGGVAIITGFNTVTQVTAQVTTAFANTSLVLGWTLSEPIISAARGWPECVTFHKGRLWFGGLRSLPASFMASRVADFFNFNTNNVADNDGIFATIDSDQVNAIFQMTSGRALQVFTSGSELVIDPPDGVITPKSIAVQEQTRRGIQRFARVGEVDGANLFVQAGGAAIRQFLFSDAEAAWRSDIASLLAPHLVLSPIDVTVRKGVAQDDADYVLLPNRTDTMAVMTTLRAQEVAAFCRCTTSGTILAAAPLASGEVYFVVNRSGTLRVERWSTSNRLDAAVRRVEATPFTTLSGTSHLPGLAALILDGAYQGLVAVNGAASITLPRAAREAQLGLPFDLRVRTLPLEPRDPAGAIIGQRSRISRLTLRVNTSGTFAVQGQAVNLRGVGDAPNPPLNSPPPILTGDVQLRGLIGWRERHTVEITQPVPGPLEVLAIATRLEVAD